ncbi:MAG: hypothetical protein K5777_06430 [Nitrosopumilus sp.]|nr:hypothetical protein [Nitrosopumilus sp.]
MGCGKSFVYLLAFAVLFTVGFSPYLTQDAFAASPLSSAVANDPDDGDAVFSVGDTVLIKFPAGVNATNGGSMSLTEFNNNFTTTNPAAFDGTITATWQTPDADGPTELLISWSAITTALQITTTTVGYNAGGNLFYAVNATAGGAGTEFTTTAVNLTGDFGLFVAATATSNGGGSGCIDCEAPTLGVDDDGRRLVDGGFTYNGNSIDVERYFTPYPLVTVSVGKQNVAEFKIYDDKGPDSISHFELAFGLANGESIGKSKAVINWDRTFDGIETVTIDDPENVLDKIKVTTSEDYCSDESQQKCLIVKVTHTFRAPLDFNILGTNVWDTKRNAWQNYYNHGIEVVGDSLNHPKEHDGINKGHVYHLTETSKTTAVDEFGNPWSLEYGLWNKDHSLHKNPVTLFLKEIISKENGLAGSDQFGTMYYLTETSATTAVDLFGNLWTFDGELWTMDYIYSKMILDKMGMNSYSRENSQFNIYKQGQSLLAESHLNQICPECLDESYLEINDIFTYEYPTVTNSLEHPEIQKIMNLESEKASNILDHIFDPLLYKK